MARRKISVALAHELEACHNQSNGSGSRFDGEPCPLSISFAEALTMSSVWKIRSVMTVLALISLGASNYALIFGQDRLSTSERAVLLYVGLCSALLLGRYWHLLGNPER